MHSNRWSIAQSSFPPAHISAARSSYHLNMSGELRKPKRRVRVDLRCPFPSAAEPVLVIRDPTYLMLARNLYYVQPSSQ